MDTKDAGRLGGTKVRDLLGTEHFKEIGKKGGAAVSAEYGREHYVRIGKMGGAKNREKAQARKEQETP